MTPDIRAAGMIRIFPILATIALAACGEPAHPDIAVTGAWARETAQGQKSGATYASIRNSGDRADQLIAVTTDRAAMPMIHSTTSENGIARMRMLQSLDVPAGGSVELSPGGTHVMMEGLNAPLRAGEPFQMTFRFKYSGDLVVPVKVEAAGAR